MNSKKEIEESDVNKCKRIIIAYQKTEMNVKDLCRMFQMSHSKFASIIRQIPALQEFKKEHKRITIKELSTMTKK